MGEESVMNNPEIQLNPRIKTRQIPPLSYTIQNILISIGTIASASLSFIFTIFVVLPLSVIRTLLCTKSMIAHRCPTGNTKSGHGNNAVDKDAGKSTEKKVVLIVGASRGIGFNVLKQYMNDPNVVIIAASRSIDSVRSMVVGLGDTPATLQCAELDLTGTRNQIAEGIRNLDKQYGPITHLYEVSGIANHVQDKHPWGLDITDEMINVNVSGTIASVLTMYELMKARQYGKICIVGSVAGAFGPANMISYSATKAFINSFSTSLRVLAAPCGVEVVTVQPGFIDTRMTRHMRAQGSTVPDAEFADAEGMAKQMKKAVEDGGVGVVSWPVRQSVLMYACRAVNPICEELGKWISMKSGIAGKKIS